MRNTLYILAATLFFSCNSNPTVPPPTETIETPIINKATWLLGTWQAVEGNQKMVESWEKQNDSLFVGEAFLIQGMDTTPLEAVAIKAVAKDLFYCPTVSNQNGGRTIEFKLTAATDTTLVFENPTHDFPQKITYTKHSEQKLTAEISGMMEGSMQKQAYPMTRVQ